MSDRNYRYQRPIEGQPEELWFNALPEATRETLLAETKAGMIARRDAWNESHLPERHIPRPDTTARKPKAQSEPLGSIDQQLHDAGRDWTGRVFL